MRTSVIVSAVAMFAVTGGLAYIQVSREPAADAGATPATAQPSQPSTVVEASESERAAIPSTVSVTSTETESISIDAAEPPAPRADTIDQWIKDTHDSNPRIRAAAIANLANAPKAQALPALQEVIDTGEPDVDRHIALSSLHALALRDGDRDSQIRDVMRRAIYHSDNDEVTQTAQSLLDDAEAALTERQQN